MPLLGVNIEVCGDQVARKADYFDVKNYFEVTMTKSHIYEWLSVENMGNDL